MSVFTSSGSSATSYHSAHGQPDIIHDLARRGAVARLAELQAELAEIQSAFPDLVGHKGRVIRRRYAKRKSLTAAQKRAISKAQKARWAKWREKKAGKG